MGGAGISGLEAIDVGDPRREAGIGDLECTIGDLETVACVGDSNTKGVLA